MKRFGRFLAKHYNGITVLALCSIFIVADAEPHAILAYSPVPITLCALSWIGKRLSDTQESEEL